MQATMVNQKKKRRGNRWLIFGIIGLVLVVGFVFVNGRLAQARQAQEALLAQTGDTVTAFIGDLAASATASGQVEAEQTATLSVGAPGLVDEVMVQVGERVTAGAPLVQLDTTTLAFQVERAQQNLTLQQAELTALLDGSSEADIASAEAAVNSAKVALDNLLDGPSEQSIAESEANLRSLEANVTSASASYNGTLNSVTGAAIAAAELDVLNAQLAYDSAKEVNEDNTNADTHEALENAANDLAVAQTKLADLQSGPNQGSLTSSAANVSVAQANADRAAANHQLLLNGATAQQIAAAEAGVAQAEASLATLLEPATAEAIAIAEAGVAQATLSLADAEAALADATVTAPFDGMITAVLIDTGEYATGSVIEIVADEFDVVLSVDEIDVGVLSVGQEAIITMETWPDVDIPSEIAFIAPNANNNGDLVTYDVHLRLGETELPILVGMTANARLITANNENVLLVPNAAVTADRQANTYTVNKVVGENEGAPVLEEVEVTIGLRDSDFTQITGGLAEGDEVVLGGLDVPVFEFGGGPFGGG